MARTIDFALGNEPNRAVGAFYWLLDARLTQIALSKPNGGWPGGGDGFEVRAASGRGGQPTRIARERAAANPAWTRCEVAGARLRAMLFVAG